MDRSFGKGFTVLKQMSVTELREMYAETFGEPTRAGHKDWLVKRIAWRLQALKEGDLSDRARRRAAELANDADLRRTPPKSPPPAPDAAERSTVVKTRFASDCRLPLSGSLLTRQYRGETVVVKVLSNGFEYDGELYRSLTAVAEKITGTHCNGYLFFDLKKKGASQ